MPGAQRASRIAVIKNGSGPTAILQAGNHGDEYEGPITLGEMIRELDPAQVNGRLIFLPAINTPAVLAGRRTSPVDGLNLNRTFPGDEAGTITQQISAYVSDVIMPLGDAYLDLHSGGSSLNILPSAIIEPSARPGAPPQEHRGRPGLRRPARRSSSTISASRAPRRRPRCARG